MTNSEKAEQAKRNLQKIFAENPELKQAFKETLEETRKPENVEKMAADICKGLTAIQQVIKEVNKNGNV